MQDTWYVLEDGRTVDPNEVSTDESGVLVHVSGVPVAMRSPGVPRSRGVDPEMERARVSDLGAAAEKSRAKADGEGKTGKRKGDGEAKAMKSDDQAGGYKTREAKPD